MTLNFEQFEAVRGGPLSSEMRGVASFLDRGTRLIASGARSIERYVELRRLLVEGVLSGVSEEAVARARATCTQAEAEVRRVLCDILEVLSKEQDLRKALDEAVEGVNTPDP